MKVNGENSLSVRELILARLAEGQMLRAMARDLVRLAGEDPRDKRRVELRRRQLQRWRDGARPQGANVPLLAELFGVPPHTILRHQGARQAVTAVEERLARLEEALARIAELQAETDDQLVLVQRTLGVLERHVRAAGLLRRRPDADPGSPN